MRWSWLTWFQIRSSIYETLHILLHNINCITVIITLEGTMSNNAQQSDNNSNMSILQVLTPVQCQYIGWNKVLCMLNKFKDPFYQTRKWLKTQNFTVALEALLLGQLFIYTRHWKVFIDWMYIINISRVYVHLFQKMLLGRTVNVNCRTTIARLKRNVGIEY